MFKQRYSLFDLVAFVVSSLAGILVSEVVLRCLYQMFLPNHELV